MRHNARLLCQYRTHHDALLFSPDGNDGVVTSVRWQS